MENSGEKIARGRIMIRSGDDQLFQNDDASLVKEALMVESPNMIVNHTVALLARLSTVPLIHQRVREVVKTYKGM